MPFPVSGEAPMVSAEYRFAVSRIKEGFAMKLLWKKSVASILCLCMLLGMLPITALTVSAAQDDLPEAEALVETVSPAETDSPEQETAPELPESTAASAVPAPEPEEDTPEDVIPPAAEAPETDPTEPGEEETREEPAEGEIAAESFAPEEQPGREETAAEEEGAADFWESIGDSLDKETENTLLEAYFYRSFFPGASVQSSDFSGNHLTNPIEKELYDKLKARVMDIAAGREVRTAVSVSIPNPSEGSPWTGELLHLNTLMGGDGKVSSEALGSILAAVGLKPVRVIYAVRGDCPYEMFWFDLKWSNGFRYRVEKDEHGNIIGLYNLTYTMSPTVTEAYREPNTDLFTASAEKISAVNSAIANAHNIIFRHAGKPDIDKIYAYRDELCALNTYNHDAADGKEGRYGDPWQIIYMFDGDPTTRVVCEGYAKSFQFLCECTEFNRKEIYAFSVTGILMHTATDTGGGHMWNIIHMDDGRNYLVDVTNSDAGNVGNDRYFFAVPLSGDPNAGYFYADNYFVYDADTRSLFSDEELHISDSPYVPPQIIIPPTADGTCGENISWKLDPDGILHITGEGSMYDFPDISDVPWKSERDSIRGVEISSGITHIGSNAFAYCAEIAEVTIPAGVSSIGDNAFYWAASLTDIRFLGNAPTLGSEVFYNMSVRVSVPCGMDSWKDSLFSAYGSSVTLQKKHPENQIISIPAIAPTLYAPGQTEGKKCQHCGQVIDLPVEIDQLLVEMQILPPESVQIFYRDAVQGSLIRPGFYGIDTNGNIAASPDETVSYALYVQKTPAGKPAQTWLLGVKSRDSQDATIDPAKGKLTWTSTNSRLAAVSEDASGNRKLTVKANMEGTCIITATTKDPARKQASISVHVMDYTPKLAVSGVMLNTYQAEETLISVAAGCGNRILDVEFVDGSYVSAANGVPGHYTSCSNGLQVTDWTFNENTQKGLIALKATKGLPNKTIKGQLYFRTEYGDYWLKLNVVSKSQLPAITVKQQNPFCLFYKDSAASLTVTAKNSKVLGWEVDETYNGTFTEAENDGETTVVFAEGQETYKPASRSIRLLVHVEGWELPIDKVIALNTDTNKPICKLSSAAGILNSRYGEQAVRLHLTDSTGGPMELEPGAVIRAVSDYPFAEIQDNPEGNTIVLRLKGSPTAGGKVVFNVTQPNWTAPLRFAYSLTVSTADPITRLSTGSLSLSRLFPERASHIGIQLNQENLTVSDFVWELTAAPRGVDTAAAADWFRFSPFAETGDVTVSLQNGNAVKGTYTFRISAKAAESESLPVRYAVLKINVTDSLPALKLSAASVTLCKALPDNTAEIKLNGLDGYTIRGLRVIPTGTASAKAQAERIVRECDPDTGTVTLSLESSKLPGGSSYVFQVIAEIECFGGTAAVSTPLKVKLTR